MLLPWVSALCYGGTGPYVAVRLREQGETMLTGDEVYYGVGPVPTSFHLAARKGWLEQAFRRCGAAHQPWGHSPDAGKTLYAPFSQPDPAWGEFSAVLGQSRRRGYTAGQHELSAHESFHGGAFRF